jgi:pepF/M3 family oligoendopeptidase
MTETKLPHWDLTPLFPSLDSGKFQAAWTDLEGRVEGLEPLFNKHEVGPRPMRGSDRAAFAEITTALNEMFNRLLPVEGFVECHVDMDSTDQAAQARSSELEEVVLGVESLWPRLFAWLARLDPEKVGAGPYKILLDDAQFLAEHMMSEPEEVLAAEFDLSGGNAWAGLYDRITTLITAAVQGKELPIAAVRNLAYNPDPTIRKEAYDAEIAAWKAHEVPLAAALNGVKGQASTLNRKRRWANDLEPALFWNRISSRILAAMQDAVVASFPLWHRYFHAKARLLGKEKLDWWDLAAPVGESEKRWTWDESATFIVEQLRTFSPSVADLTSVAFRERWIDAEPRNGKGAEGCRHMGGGKSRILVNFEGSFASVSTLAHELGHAYHSHCLRERPPLLLHSDQMDPLTLAETASIMNETILVQAALRTLPAGEQLSILEADLREAAESVVDIHSRFLFEKAVFEQRAKREISADEFCSLMLEAQKATYGAALATYHPYMWAAKSHYYGTDFYNFPYTFGLLFALALYHKYVEDGQAFVARYDDLLASVGMYSASDLAARFGFDLESRSFWEGGLAVLGERVARFEGLAR